MPEAIEQARIAGANDEVPVGAVIVRSSDAKIIAKAYNLVEKSKNPTFHAELLAINSACASLKNKNLAGHDIYVTLQPCPMCLQAIILAKISRIYFGAYDLSAYSNFILQANHKLEIYGGIMEEECSLLLKHFFKNRR